MLVHALRRHRRRPRLLPRRRASGGRRAAAPPRTPAGAPASGWSPRPTSPTRSFLELAPRDRGGHERRARPPLPLVLASRADASVRDASRARRRCSRWAPTAASTRSPRASRVVRFDADAPGPPSSSCACRAATTVLNARAALAAVELAGFDVDASRRAPCRLSRNGAPPAAQGRPRRRRGLRRLRPPPDRGRGDAGGAARARAAAPDRRLPAPPLLADEGAGAERFGRALAAADEVGVLDVYPAREQPVGDSPASAASRSRAPPPTTPAAGRCWWLGDAETRRARPRPAAARGRPAGDDRRRATSSSLADRLVVERAGRAVRPPETSSATTRSRG